MILQCLDTDKESPRACSRTVHDFRYVAQFFLGSHCGETVPRETLMIQREATRGTVARLVVCTW